MYFNYHCSAMLPSCENYRDFLFTYFPKLSMYLLFLCVLLLLGLRLLKPLNELCAALQSHALKTNSH